MIETKQIDVERPVNQTKEIVHFTDVNDMHWAGVINLPPSEPLLLTCDTRNDIYILQGELIDSVGSSYTRGAFLRPGVNSLFMAGSSGAKLFVYRDHHVLFSDEVAMKPEQLNWREGGAPGMRVASLGNAGESLMLVSWSRGSQMRFHNHPAGEEIFVLQGELCDQSGQYPAGTWLRLHPGTGHAPYSETDTLILLRNGHLHM